MPEIPGLGLLTLAALGLTWETHKAPIAVYASRWSPVGSPPFHEIKIKAGAGFGFCFISFCFGLFFIKVIHMTNGSKILGEPELYEFLLYHIGERKAT